jgi:hypothetical protein
METETIDVEFYMGMDDNYSTHNADGSLPWINSATGKADLLDFKRYTLGKKVVMGSTTYSMMPSLKGRQSYVLGRKLPKKKMPRMSVPEQTVYQSNCRSESGLVNSSLIGKTFEANLEPVSNEGHHTSVQFIDAREIPNNSVVIGGPTTFNRIAMDPRINVTKVVVGAHVKKAHPCLEDLYRYTDHVQKLYGDIPSIHVRFYWCDEYETLCSIN